MWIRSQDRLRLQYVNRFEIEHFENKEIATITGHGWFLIRCLVKMKYSVQWHYLEN